MRFHQAGYEVVACKHVMDAMRDAASGRIDTIVLNLDMPGFGGSFGIEALREIAPRVSVIGISDKAQGQTKNPVSFDLLPRTASPENFLRAVERALLASHDESLPPSSDNDDSHSPALTMR